jgi:hypothetical protein
VYESAPATFILKLNHTRLHGKQRIVAAKPNIQSGFNLGSPLPNEDRSAAYELSRKTLYPKPFGLAVSSIPGASNSLFMCHTYLTSLLH